MNLSIIIIDKNQTMRSAFCAATSRIPGIKLMGNFADIYSAMEFIKKNGKIDVIFCDIETSRINGVYAITFLKLICQSFVFITTESKYALEALSIHADGYLIKPIDQILLLENLYSLKDWKELTLIMQKKDNIVYIKGGSKGQFLKVDLDRVICIEAMLNYVKIHLHKNSYITYITLKNIEEKLSSRKNFIRISKSMIVNTHNITVIDGTHLEMENGKNLYVGERYRELFYKLIKERAING